MTLLRVAGLTFLALLGAPWNGSARAVVPTDPAAPPPVETRFEQELRPLLGRYCLDCHSTARAKGDLDLERFSTATAAGREPKIWQGVAEQLDHGEMPPRDQPQPTPAERATLRAAVDSLLDSIARARAGDPGPVLLRRLSNAEYTYTLRDLTGVATLDPAREFPVDGAAGEGFMNVGAGLVMSPSLLTKYLDAARAVAAHAVLLPEGFRFSPSTSRRDWTDEILAEIRARYRAVTDDRGSTRVHLQGLVWDTNEGGRLPLDRYLTALWAGRHEPATHPSPGAAAAAAEAHALSPRYLATLREALDPPATTPSIFLDPLRARWRTVATAAEAADLATEVSRWQAVLWRFQSVGHIGKVGGPTAWMEPVSPLTNRHEIRLRPPAPPLPEEGAELTLELRTTDAGDGNTGDVVVWEQPRFVQPGRPDLLLRDVPAVARARRESRRQVLASVTNCLAAAAEAARAAGDGAPPDASSLNALARRHGAEPAILAGWLTYLGLNATGPARIEGHFTGRLERVGGFDFVQGWGSAETPSFVANASDQAVRIPGNLPSHAVALHPSPTQQALVGWRSPIAGRVRPAATITHAHPECGNGVTWTLEFRRGTTRQRLAAGTAHGSQPVRVDPLDPLPVRPGDVIVLAIGPRDGNHACDLTAVEFTLTPTDAGNAPVWDLAADVATNVHAGNPHPDQQGHAEVWHFFGEPTAAGPIPGESLPPGSLLAHWRATEDPSQQAALAAELSHLLHAPPAPALPPASPSATPPQAAVVASVPAASIDPNLALRRQMLSLGGPLLRAIGETTTAPGPDHSPAAFGRTPTGQPLDPRHLGMPTPATVQMRIPADLVEGSEFVTTGTLHPTGGDEGSVQLSARIVPPGPSAPPAETSNPTPGLPIVTLPDSAARTRLAAAAAEFRALFPPALAYTRIVPVDEVVTLTLFHREDEPLQRLMLEAPQRAELDQLWDQLRYVSEEALTLVDAYAQLMEYATQDADPKVFEPLREPIRQRAAEFRQRLETSQPHHLEALLGFAARAYRRPLAPTEAQDLRGLYQQLRDQELGHEEAFRLTLARILVAPAFLYRAEKPAPGPDPGPVSDWELATRLSYFLWSSAPDAELRELAATGRLQDPDVLAAQARRLVQDDRIRRLAVEFGCQWLHLRGFDELDEKSERHFPTFAALRSPMYEESIRFFIDFFQQDAGIDTLLDSDHTFLNEALARHYEIPGIEGDTWRRVDGMRARARGGLLGLAATLAKQSGASRTSPILRGNWVSEVLLGERLPRPPKDVPQLPADETATAGLTVRQLVERHSADPRCAGCHVRIDPYGFALEGFDAIGRRRTHDLGDRPIATQAKTADGAEFADLDGLRQHLLTRRHSTFQRQFLRKLLGYALGREVLLSDGPFLDELQSQIATGGDHVGVAIEAIVRSPQFRSIRGREFSHDL